MVRTNTIYLKFESLSRRGEEGLLVIRLMMAFNDLSVTNECMSIFKKRHSKNKSDKNLGAAMYFIRAQSSHLYEAMKIVKIINDNDKLKMQLNACSSIAKNAFKNLIDYLPDGTKNEQYQKYVGRLRNNITFHYDESGKLIKKYVDKRATDNVSNNTSITRSDSVYEWRFKLADDVVESIVCRDIWKIPENANLSEEADIAVDFAHEIFINFMDFSGDFIFKYCRK